MSAIYYIATSRADLIQDSPAHVAGTQYSFDIGMNEYLTEIETPNKQIVTLGGQVETILYRVGEVITTRLGPFAHSERPQIKEFIYSIAAGDIFQFDPWGSVASEDEKINVVSINSAYSEERITHGATPLRWLTMTLRKV